MKRIHEAAVVLYVDDSPGTLSKISDILSTNHYRVIDMNASITGKDIEKITLRLEIKDNLELGKLLDLFTDMKSVKRVRRF